MFSSSILASILASAAAEPAESDSMARAKELLDLVKSPTAVATGVLLAFATSQLNLNDSGTIDQRRTRWAVIAAMLGVVLAVAVTGVMSPLALRVTISNRGGPVETRLLVYMLTYLVAIGTTLYGISIARRSLQHARSAFSRWADFFH